MNLKLFVFLSLAATILTQAPGPFKPQSCLTNYPPNDPTNEGCKTCLDYWYKKKVTTRILSQKERFLQTVGKNKYTCIKCPEGCKDCEDTTVKGTLTCTSCKNSNYYPIKKTFDKVQRITKCEKCLPGCFTCNDGKTCNMSSGCRDGYWKDETNKQCPACKKGCSKCISATNCSHCTLGYFLKGVNCLACIQGCEKCNNTSSCSKCYDTYELKNGICKKKPFYKQIWFWLIIVLLIAIAACVACYVVGQMKDKAFKEQNSMLSNEHQ